jgi:hypothetical protein
MADCMVSQDMNDVMKAHFMYVIRKVGQEITHQVVSYYSELSIYRPAKFVFSYLSSTIFASE